jgi:hypothetical protein
VAAPPLVAGCGWAALPYDWVWEDVDASLTASSRPS